MAGLTITPANACRAIAAATSNGAPTPPCLLYELLPLWQATGHCVGTPNAARPPGLLLYFLAASFSALSRALFRSLFFRLASIPYFLVPAL